MKRLIPVLFLIILFTGSCEKEPCYECKTYTYSKPYNTLIDVETETVCGSELDIITYRTDHYIFTDSYYSSCYCTEK